MLARFGLLERVDCSDILELRHIIAKPKGFFGAKHQRVIAEAFKSASSEMLARQRAPPNTLPSSPARLPPPLPRSSPPRSASQAQARFATDGRLLQAAATEHSIMAGPDSQAEAFIPNEDLQSATRARLASEIITMLPPHWADAPLLQRQRLAIAARRAQTHGY